MKRFGGMYERICSMDNLLLAEINASKGKRSRREVLAFESELLPNLTAIREELVRHTYRTSRYDVFIKYEPKRREIYKLPFRDRVVQWAIMQVVEPVWVSQFTSDTYACIKGRGIHSLLKRLRRDLKDDAEGTRYCFKMDVKKYYPSIDHDVLKQVVRRKIKDAELLWLLDGIIDSAEGVPIGNYISQYFANLYLSELDHRLKERVGVSYYYRYADDIVVLGGSKERLREVKEYILDYLTRERKLRMKENWQIFPVESRGIDFVGYVTYHTHCLARKRNKQGLCREVAKLRKRGLSDEEIRLLTASRAGFMVHCDSIHLLNKLGMKKFSDIKPNQGKLTGTKYHIDTVLNREIHLTAYEISKSKINSDDMLTLQYEILEQLPTGDGRFQVDDEGKPVYGWVKHITFTGSKALIEQLRDVELTEPVAAKIIRQPIGDGKRCFYKLVDPD